MRNSHIRCAMMNSKWFLEYTSSEEGAFYSLQKIIFNKASIFQHIEIIESGAFGKCLILDGKMQSSEADEFIYHEAIVHPAMISHDFPQRVFVAGGGEGATAREILKHPSVKEIVIVDLDRDAVDACKKYLPEWHQGAFEDKRVRIYFEDGRSFLEKSDNFDIIILDLPESADGGPALMLYTKEFYKLVYNRLNIDGIAVAQAASTASHNLNIFSSIAKTLLEVFPIVRPYTANVPSFFTPWGFMLASKKTDPLSLSSKYIDKKLDVLKDSLNFYDSETHLNLFSLPKNIRSAIKNQNRIITDNQPASFY